MAAVFLLRHGETAWSANGRHTGHTDVSLTAAGERAARSAGRVLAGCRFAAVLTSPLVRARQTAALAGFPAATVDGDLREWDYGRYEGLTTPQIRAERPGWLLWRDGCPDGEDAGQVGARADRVIELLRAADGDALVVAHGHLLRVLAVRWVGLPPADGGRLALSTAAICRLGWEREVAVIDRWNGTDHLRVD